jgi:hypothetical protein
VKVVASNNMGPVDHNQNGYIMYPGKISIICERYLSIFAEFPLRVSDVLSSQSHY